jgi:threonine/homoserine/homoserine lactone efflux protein
MNYEMLAGFLVGMLITIISFIVLGSYCYFASLSRKLFLKEISQKRINKAAGTVMAAAGIYVILK